MWFEIPMGDLEMSDDMRPPADLSARSQAIWLDLMSRYQFTVEESELAVEALRALDEADAARVTLAAEGFTAVDRSGGVKVHPLADVVHRRRAFYATAMRQLGLVKPAS